MLKTDVPIEKYDIYIFDFDGTIIDSKELMKKSLENCVKQYNDGYRIDYKLFFSLMGDSLENIFEKMGLPTDLAKGYREYSVNNVKEVKLFPQVVHFIQYLYQMKKKIILFTGKDRARTMELLRIFKLQKYFNMIITPDDLTYPKPHPEGVQIVLDKYKINNNKAILIGDGRYDILAAKGANIHAMYVDWGTGNLAEISELQPNYILYQPEELNKLVFKEEIHAKFEKQEYIHN
ncbi:HAD family hydrolase [Bacillus cereus]|uniref:HAD family hydrolase n=1 Tax=Bacillus cereus TaxID=1396 RepID=UPI002ED818D4